LLVLVSRAEVSFRSSGRRQSISVLPRIVFSNSGSRCQPLHDHPCRVHCSLRGRGMPSA
jgi:hypothetical protein